MIKVREVRIGKEVKRSNGWWHFTCGDVFINVYQCWSWPLSWSLRCRCTGAPTGRRRFGTEIFFQLEGQQAQIFFDSVWVMLSIFTCLPGLLPKFSTPTHNGITKRFKMRKQIDLRGFKGQDSSITGAKILQNCASLILICIYLHLISSDVWYPVTRAD